MNDCIQLELTSKEVVLIRMAVDRLLREFPGIMDGDVVTLSMISQRLWSLYPNRVDCITYMNQTDMGGQLHG